MAGVAVVAVVLIVLFTSQTSKKTVQAAAQPVALQPAGSTGPDPYTGSVATPATSTTASSPPPTATGAAGAGTTRSGDEVGLYGGSTHLASCDSAKLIAFLEANPDKGRAWAGVEGIEPSGISAYVHSLTPVVLRVDTRVTNHGYREGAATSFQSVLQAGTAVLVDSHGVPQVRCACGNPLLPPVTTAASSFTGSGWEGFQDHDVVTVVPTPTQLKAFVLVDQNTGKTFTRPVGGTGTTDQTTPARSASPSASSPASASASESRSTAPSASPSTAHSPSGSATNSATGSAPPTATASASG